MPDIVLDPDPRSTVEASDEYKAAWFAAFGDGSPDEPPTPPDPVLEQYVISEAVLPDYLKRENFSGSVFKKVHVQSAPAATWTIEHGFGKVPNAVLVTQGGEVVETDTHIDAERVVLTFGTPQSGEVSIIG